MKEAAPETGRTQKCANGKGFARLAHNQWRRPISELTMQTQRKILCIEDDRETAALIAEELVDRGYAVTIAHDGREGLAAILKTMPDLVLSDISMPLMSGFELLERLIELAPRFAKMPFVFLTALSDRDNELKGRQLGADDYVTKPFSPRELLARIKTVLRRCAPQHADMVVEVAGLKLDPASRRITGSGQDIELGALEFRMLRFFMTHPGRVYSRAQLLDEIWGNNVYVEERTVDVHIRRLRQALEPTGHKELLETVRGVGYCFRRDLPAETPRVPNLLRQAQPPMDYVRAAA